MELFGNANYTPIRGKSNTTAAILAVVLGTMGVHHFYRGNTALGFVYLGISVISGGMLGIFVWGASLVDAYKLMNSNKKQDIFDSGIVEENEGFLSGNDSSGGIIGGANAERVHVAKQVEKNSIELLKEYHDLLKAGILTQEEFDEKKEEFLG